MTLKQGKPKDSPNRIKLPLWCVGAIALLWLAGYLAYQYLERYLVVLPLQESTASHLDAAADHYRERIDQRIAQVVDRVEAVAADPRTLEVLLSPDRTTSKWQEMARTLRAINPQTEWLYSAKIQLPDAERILLVNPSRETQVLPGNFVADLMMEEARAGGRPAPRAARTEQWHIYVARPVMHDANVAGVLLVEYKPAIFRRATAQGTDLQGRVDLIQAVERFPDVAVYTDGTGWKDQFSAIATTRYDDWKVKFTGSKALIDSLQVTPTSFYAAVVLLLAILLTSTAFLVKRCLPRSRAPSRSIPPPSHLDNLFTQKHIRDGEFSEQRRRARAQVLSEPHSVPSAEAESAVPQKARDKIQELLPEHVFRDYDIRGKAHTEIGLEFAELLGRALGTLMLQRGEHTLAVCADGRVSSPRLKKSLSIGILSTGCDLIDIGKAPTPVFNYALSTLEECSSGIMVTASHNPAADNGFKIVVDNLPLSPQEIQELREEMADGSFIDAEGDSQQLDFIQQYVDYIVEDVAAPGALHIAIDCGNGIGGAVAPQLFRALGCQLVELFTEVDGDFPNHDPDPTVSANLAALIDTVTGQGLDLGLAFDGDGDRLVAVTGSGRIVWPDELLMIFARDVVARHPGADIVYDVKSTRRLEELITSYGGRPVMWKTGHAPMRNKVHLSSAPLGGEYSGHIFFNDRWFGFDDGLYAAARLLEIIGIREQTLDEILDSFPPAVATDEIRIPVPESNKQALVKRFIESSDFGDAQLVTTDGLRVEYANGWGLLRPSNTSATLTLRFEADTEASLREILQDFEAKLKAVSPKLTGFVSRAAITTRS